MKKIFILGPGRTASKLYKETLKKHDDVYILHEIMYYFRFKTDIFSILKKHGVLNSKDKLKLAVNEIYEKPYLVNFRTEFPDKEEFLKILSSIEDLSWTSVLNSLIEEKTKSLNKKIAGAKNPVHFSYAPRVIREFEDDAMILFLLRDPRALYASEIPMKSRDYHLSQFPRVKNKNIQRVLIFIYVNIEFIWAIITYKRLKNKVLLCKYEDLIGNPTGMMEKVFNFCGLTFQEDYIKDAKIIGSSHIKQNESGISSHGMKKWETILNRFEKFWFKMIIGIFNY